MGRMEWMSDERMEDGVEWWSESSGVMIEWTSSGVNGDR